MNVIKFDGNELQNSFVPQLENGLKYLDDCLEILESTTIPTSFAYASSLRYYVNEIQYSRKEIAKMIDWISLVQTRFSDLENNINSELIKLDILSLKTNDLKVKNTTLY